MINTIINNEFLLGPYNASKELIYMMIEELYIMSKFENWTKTGITGYENPVPLDDRAHADFKELQHENHLHWIFLSTRSGITAYWQLYNSANEEHIRYDKQKKTCCSFKCFSLDNLVMQIQIQLKLVIMNEPLMQLIHMELIILMVIIIFIHFSMAYQMYL